MREEVLHARMHREVEEIVHLAGHHLRGDDRCNRKPSAAIKGHQEAITSHRQPSRVIDVNDLKCNDGVRVLVLVRVIEESGGPSFEAGGASEHAGAGRALRDACGHLRAQREGTAQSRGAIGRQTCRREAEVPSGCHQRYSGEAEASSGGSRREAIDELIDGQQVIRELDGTRSHLSAE